MNDPKNVMRTDAVGNSPESAYRIGSAMAEAGEKIARSGTVSPFAVLKR